MTMDNKTALETMKKYLILGQQKGIYTLGDAKMIMEAIEIVCPDMPQEEVVQTTPEVV